ncbi:unnamed protein product [Rhodiola kirilowii]
MDLERFSRQTVLIWRYSVGLLIDMLRKITAGDRFVRGGACRLAWPLAWDTAGQEREFYALAFSNVLDKIKKSHTSAVHIEFSSMELVMSGVPTAFYNTEPLVMQPPGEASGVRDRAN